MKGMNITRMKGNEAGSVLRVGKVTEYDAATQRARVNFPELRIISHWLPVIAMNTLKTHDTHYLDAGEHVVCLMNGTGTESGYVLGAIYDDKNKPQECGQDIRSVKFDDDTTMTYDRGSHKLFINVQGDIEIVAKGHMQLTAERIDLN